MRVIAYLVPTAATSLRQLNWRDALAAELPPFMLPSAVVLLDKLPLTSNG